MIATRKDWKQRKAMREAPVPRGRIPNSLSSGERMERKLLTQRGRKLYRLRGQTVEPVFGQTKQTQGAERFMVRGEQRPKANGICIAACTISKSCTGRWFARELRRIPDNGHRFVLQNGLRCSIEDSLKYSIVAFGPNIIGPIPYHLPTQGIRQQALCDEIF